MRFLKHSKILLVFILFLSLTDAFAYKKVKTFVLIPPENPLMNVKRIAVLDFENNNVYGKNFTNYLISNLLEANRGMHGIQSGFLGLGKKKDAATLQSGTRSNIYEIVERAQLEKILEEQQLGMTGLLDQSQAVSLGSLLGVQAIITGSVNITHADKNFTRNQTVKKDGKKITKKIPCQNRKVQSIVTLRIISTETGQILGSSESTKNVSADYCRGDYKALPSVDQMVETCLRANSNEIANYFAPYYKLQSYELEKIKTNEFKKPAEKAAKSAENLDIDRAYLVYNSLYEKDSYNPRIIYNIGIMNEVVGNYTAAREFYEMAQQLADEGKYRDARKRCEKAEKFANILSDIGLPIKPHVFQVSQEELAAATAKRIEVKGKREQRIAVYKSPRKGGEIAAKVPGGVSFEVIKKEGEFYLIKLLGGKQGYIHKSKVK